MHVDRVMHAHNKQSGTDVFHVHGQTHTLRRCRAHFLRLVLKHGDDHDDADENDADDAADVTATRGSPAVTRRMDSIGVHGVHFDFDRIICGLGGVI